MTRLCGLKTGEEPLTLTWSMQAFCASALLRRKTPKAVFLSVNSTVAV